jgi:predicted nucleic acid-binding protein
MIYCFDACAIIALLDDEPGAEIVQNIISRVIDDDSVAYMSIVNYAEVYYDRLKIGKPEKADEFGRIFSLLPVTIIENIPLSVARYASYIKINYKTSLADSLGVEAAKDINAVFVTSDHHELEKVEIDEPVKFLWLPAKPKK